LEFPSDPWEYFKYIFEYRTQFTVRLADWAPPNLRFSYYFSWTLVKWFAIEDRREAINLLGAFWQTLFCLQFYFLAKRLGNNSRLSVLQTFAVVLFMGYSILNYVRYLALSANLVSFIFYFYGLGQLVEMAKSNQIRKYAIGFALSLIGIGLTHNQGYMWMIISILALLFYKWFSKKQFHPSTKKYWQIMIATNFILVFGWFNMMLRQVGSKITSFSLSDVEKILDFSDIYSSTIGIHGLINASLALFFIFSFPLPSILTLTPVFLVIFPPTLKAIRFILPYSLVSHRVFYAFSSAYFLVVGLDYASRLITQNKKIFQTCVIVVGLLLLASPTEGPYQGRLQHLIIQTPPELDLRILDPAIEWLQANRTILRNRCHFQSDRITHNFITAHIGGENIIGRLSSQTLTYTSVEDVIKSMNELPLTCGILIAKPELVPAPPPSLINNHIHHWDNSPTDIRSLYSESMIKLVEQAAAQEGWKKTEIPPFYILYEPKPQ
jgi:hypothetical protein